MQFSYSEKGGRQAISMYKKIMSSSKLDESIQEKAKIASVQPTHRRKEGGGAERQRQKEKAKSRRSSKVLIW